MALIYMAVNTANNKAYIGKTVESLPIRKRKHKNSANKGSKSLFHKAIRKYGLEVFEWFVIETVLDNEVNDAERFWIAYFKSIGATLYNLTIGGEGTVGYKHTVEAKEMCRLAAIKQKDEQTRLRQSALAKKQHANGHTEVLHAGRDRYLRNQKRVDVTLISPSGERFYLDYNVTLFGREHNIDPSGLRNLIKGKYRQYKGWTRI